MRVGKKLSSKHVRFGGAGLVQAPGTTHPRHQSREAGSCKGARPPVCPPAEIRQTRVPAIDGPFGGDNGKQMISACSRSNLNRVPKSATGLDENPCRNGRVCGNLEWKVFRPSCSRLGLAAPRRWAVTLGGSRSTPSLQFWNLSP
jgi:hypothetical protein